jgi:hypothetical protein
MNAWLRVIYEPLDPIQVNLSFPGIECLLPIAIICGICVLATVVWALAVGKYTCSHGKHA